MVEAPTKSMSDSAAKLHSAVRCGLDYAARTFAERQPDGVSVLAAAVTLAAGAYALGIARALGEK